MGQFLGTMGNFRVGLFNTSSQLNFLQFLWWDSQLFTNNYSKTVISHEINLKMSVTDLIVQVQA